MALVIRTAALTADRRWIHHLPFRLSTVALALVNLHCLHHRAIPQMLPGVRIPLSKDRVLSSIGSTQHFI